MPQTDALLKQENVCIKNFPDCPRTKLLAQHWVMVKRERGDLPVFHGCPMPRHRKGDGERNSRILMAYFHPWVLHHDDACEHVPTFLNLVLPIQMFE